jgi:hypothetical protein
MAADPRSIQISEAPNVSAIFGHVSLARHRSSNPLAGRRRASSG